MINMSCQNAKRRFESSPLYKIPDELFLLVKLLILIIASQINCLWEYPKLLQPFYFLLME